LLNAATVTAQQKSTDATAHVFVWGAVGADAAVRGPGDLLFELVLAEISCPRFTGSRRITSRIAGAGRGARCLPTMRLCDSPVFAGWSLRCRLQIGTCVPLRMQHFFINIALLEEQ
jgi:hypothetical protein